MKRNFYTAIILSVVLSAVSADTSDYDDSYDDYSTESNSSQVCDPSTNCKLPDCSCFGMEPVIELGKRVPQFIMLTFDDAVTTLNIHTYRNITRKRKNSNGCLVGATFFVTHEYNDYQFVNELYRNGHEIAVHSITHESNTDTWRDAPEDRWRREMVGMRRMLEKYAKIPASEVKGHRAPFLQTGGDVTFKVLRDNGFSYDSSMPTRVRTHPPLWPYTLDFGYPQDCQIMPCPTSSFPGLWIFPMVQWERNVTTKGKFSSFHCSMLDACTPYPETAADTKKYFMENFNRHYKTNKAPFPVFLHEAWLKNSERLQGYRDFLGEVLQEDDVFAVTMSEVMDYLKNPTTLEEYKEKKCRVETLPETDTKCNPIVCNYPRRTRLMKSCIPCVKRYPWLENPEGRAKSE